MILKKVRKIEPNNKDAKAYIVKLRKELKKRK